MKHEQFIGSPAYRDLTTRARCLLEEFQRIYKPGRNGELSISVENAAKLLNCCANSARNAFRELEEKGFLALCCEASYSAGRATEYRLTIEPHNGRAPTDDWMDWEPDKPILLIGKRRKAKQNDTSKFEQERSKNCTTPPQNLRLIDGSKA